ncbi:MAG: hypothetical protein PGN21_03735 [Sphingomonas paucimobilis]
MRVVERGAPVLPDAPIPAPSTALVVAVQPDVLRALRLPATAAITGIARDDPREGIVCGSVAVPGGTPARFVYLGTAGMAAMDDGDTAFETLRRRLCGS